MKITVIITILIMMCIPVFAEEDMLSIIEQQRADLEQKEASVKAEIERLKTLKKEINADITKYNDLLLQIDASLNKAENLEEKRLKHVARAYEAMQPEDAASRLMGLDNDTSVQILLKMNSKKAGLVIGMMEAKKATQITKEIAKLKKE